MKYAELVEKARETYESEDTPHVVKAWLLANIIYPADESEDERMKREILELVSIAGNGNQFEEIKDWLEKQGEKKHIINVPPREVILSICDLGTEWRQLTYGCISTEYGTQLDYIQKHWHESEYYLKEKQGKKLDAYDVIEWIDKHVPTKFEDMRNYVNQFKKDFEL